MEIEDSWRVLLNEQDEKFSRLIFTGCKCRRLIDITIQSQNVNTIISAVLTSNWSTEQLMDFLNLESARVFKTAI
ncbi:Hypothetical protein LUCI_1722 [Lucifera butyrica]|uniref:Uncharacterized protein n=1 Tax=Lucifera butyrica TaxID=1351585 RepID=A0A498R5Q8_9FIRM|nr:hypothetical protein [Lucifera butyrica]VBB06489.1 Hypothetical protein LUCI_1722 [Lucifera butyrica]